MRRSSIICNLDKILLIKSKEDVIGVAHGGDEKYVKTLGWKA
jgi:hypothetical protein